MGYTIRNCPNEPDVVDAARRLTRDTKELRLRGRGVPAGGRWKDYQYGTPMSVAPRFCVYVGSYPYVRGEYMGVLPDGRLRVRYLGETS